MSDTATERRTPSDNMAIIMEWSERSPWHGVMAFKLVSKYSPDELAQRILDQDAAKKQEARP